MKKEDMIAILVLGGVGIYAFSKRGEAKDSMPWLDMGGVPSFDLSGLLSGISLGGGGGLIDLVNQGKEAVSDVTDFFKETTEALTGGGGGEGETEIVTTGEPTQETWSEVAKGFISEHPILASSIAIPVTAAVTYGAIKATPLTVKIATGIYNTFKLPQGFSVWKALKVTPKPQPIGIGAKLGVGGVLKSVGLGALIIGGAATITDLAARYTPLAGGKPYFGQSLIEFLSFAPGRVSATIGTTGYGGFAKLPIAYGGRGAGMQPPEPPQLIYGGRGGSGRYSYNEPVPIPTNLRAYRGRGG